MHNRIRKNLIKSRSLLHIMKVGSTTIPYSGQIENWNIPSCFSALRIKALTIKDPDQETIRYGFYPLWYKKVGSRVDVRRWEKRKYSRNVKLKVRIRTLGGVDSTVEVAALGLSSFVGPAKWEFLWCAIFSNVLWDSSPPSHSFSIYLYYPRRGFRFMLVGPGPSMETHHLMPNGPMDNMGHVMLEHEV